MKHFSVIQSLIRAGLSGDVVAFTKQVTRYRARLAKDGEKSAIETIDRLLKSVDEVKSLQPSDVEVSRAFIVGETMTEETNAPIDRETGAKLCEIHFPFDQGNAEPVYNELVGATIDSVVTEWNSVATLKKLGVEPTRSLLIFGPPGSGKTLAAQYIAQQLNLPLVVARIDGLVSSFLGTTARNIANLFDFANRYRCVFLLDEFDAVAKLRDDPHEVGEIKRVVNTLLQNLDARKHFGLTIAITNHDRLLDPAVWRRFDTHVHIAEPSEEARRQIITSFLKPLKITNEFVSLLAYCLSGMSGSDIQRLCQSAKRTLTVDGLDDDEPGVLEAFSRVVARLPSHETVAMAILGKGIGPLITHLTNEPGFPMKQTDLGRITGKDQSAISRLKKQELIGSEG